MGFCCCWKDKSELLHDDSTGEVEPNGDVPCEMDESGGVTMTVELDAWTRSPPRKVLIDSWDMARGSLSAEPPIPEPRPTPADEEPLDGTEVSGTPGRGAIAGIDGCPPRYAHHTAGSPEAGATGWGGTTA